MPVLFVNPVLLAAPACWLPVRSHTKVVSAHPRRCSAYFFFLGAAFFLAIFFLGAGFAGLGLALGAGFAGFFAGGFFAGAFLAGAGFFLGGAFLTGFLGGAFLIVFVSFGAGFAGFGLALGAACLHRGAPHSVKQRTHRDRSRAEVHQHKAERAEMHRSTECLEGRDELMETLAVGALGASASGDGSKMALGLAFRCFVRTRTRS